MLTQLNPPLWVDTPKGEGLVHFVCDYGVEHSFYWVVVIQATGECWTYQNEDIRFCKNYTLHRRTECPYCVMPSGRHAENCPG